ncbi:unnamed protein product [Rhizoctonia solani]|uniref:Uncharacterized protein n=1 Tax=Rhizoctonia solani TaxID=456999 RepID=A0A8H3HNZ4_9AGAM|nr:unnamed protein product [Rhizoctonia solani]
MPPLSTSGVGPEAHSLPWSILSIRNVHHYCSSVKGGIRSPFFEVVVALNYRVSAALETLNEFSIYRDRV